MRRDARAIVFDLDDTLYPYRRFLTSGFVAVAAHLAATTGLDARLGFAALHGASRGATRGHEIQVCLDRYDLPASLLPELVEVFRHHDPRLRRLPVITRLLSDLRESGWRLGILTNGQPSIQARKIQALGLRPLVDVVLYASACGTGEGKPDPEAFAAIARQLSAPPERTVVVGNDEHCDVSGARAAGMRAVRCDAWVRQSIPSAANAITTRLTDVPAIALALLQEDSNRHAA